MRRSRSRRDSNRRTSRLFDVSRLPLGRSFSREEEQTGAPVAVLSDRFWRDRYSKRPDVVGESLVLNGHSVTVIGVADFRIGKSDRSALYLPLGLQPVLFGGQGLMTATRPGCTSRGGFVRKSLRSKPRRSSTCCRER